MELDIIKDVFCTPHRKEPLKIGSVKSNLGHTDASSGLVSIVKAIIAMDSGYIAPNINYTTPNSQSEALKSGKIQVIKLTNLQNDITISCIDNLEKRIIYCRVLNSIFMVKHLFLSVTFLKNSIFSA